MLRDSETFGVELGYGTKFTEWLNEKAGEQGLKLEARLYGYEVTTVNFGSFEMFSWIGDVQSARRLVIRAAKRFKVKIIEGGYKTKETTFSIKRIDYAMVRRGEKIIGHIEFEAPRLGRGNWSIRAEERR